MIRALAMNPPRSPRDLIWIPARLESEYANGEVYLPALYPGTHEHRDDQARLGRLGDWRYPGGELTFGVGSRSLLVDDDIVGLLDVRQLIIDQAPEAAVGRAGPAGP
jgi:type VI secretion system protein ImpE